MLTAAAESAAVEAATPDQVPRRNVNVPAPTKPPDETCGDDSDCFCASLSTSSVNEVAAAALVTEIVAALVLLELAERAAHALAEDNLVATSARAENWDLISPMAETCALTVVAFNSRFLSGCFSSATSCDTMLETSRPLPIPAEEILAMVCPLLNQTAKIIASTHLG